MNAIAALDYLDKLLSEYPGTRADHERIQREIHTIREALDVAKTATVGPDATDEQLEEMFQ